MSPDRIDWLEAKTMVWRILMASGVGLALSWVAAVLFLAFMRPRGSLLQEALRLLPDTLRLLRRIATDSSLPVGIRVRLWLLFGYLAFPFDLVPDFIPVIGYADDAIIVVLVLRSVVRRAGAEAVRRHWPGSPQGLAALWRAAQLPGAPEA
ncbi:MAG TPA: YkvA family protein [Polyangiaceae bacterium]|nr:YkvA family protein [Polyangiaceae bacterium]